MEKEWVSGGVNFIGIRSDHTPVAIRTKPTSQ